MGSSKCHVSRVALGLGLVACIAMSFAGCATATTVQEKLVRPGQVNMAGYKQVTIEVAGPNSEQLEALLKQQLGNGNTDFEVLDRKSLNVRNGEIALRQLGVAGGPESEEKIIPAVVLFRATVLNATANERPQSRQSSDQYGNTYVYYSTAASASVKVNFEVIDLATSKQLVSKFFENTQNLQSGWSSAPQNYGEAQLTSMLANANMKVISQFISTIMPHYEFVNVALYNNSKFPANETGIRLYQLKDYQQAAKQFEEALAAAKGQADIKPTDIASLTSNLATAYEFGGRVAEALELYKAAVTLDNRQAYFQSVNRCQLRIADVQKLREQGIIQQPRSFSGVGIQLKMWNAQLTVLSPFPNSPASIAGIQPGDIVLAIDGKATTTMSLDEATHAISGDPGTVVTLRIKRSGVAVDKDYALTRATITN
jgi:tetratricopeptide (TPR) repeat protein